ncbi:MAG: hypothetical protein AAGA60_15905 [Cyanobacteria bacterium P01_E01_bin.42]
MQLKTLKPYKPSGKLSVSKLIWLPLVSVLGGATIGGIVHFISLLVYLVILFPLAIGFTGGLVTAFGVRLGKVRNPAVAMLFALLTGLTIYGTMNVLAYSRFKQTVAREIEETTGEPFTQGEVNEFIEVFLQEQVSDSGIVGYLKFRAKEGIGFRRRGASFNIGTTGTWIYWAIELALIEAMIVFLASSSARNCFCEQCEQWYDRQRIGSIQPHSSENFLSLLEGGQFNEAGKLVDPSQAVVVSGLELKQENCLSCQDNDVFLNIETAY